MTNQLLPILTTEERGYEHPVDFLWDGGASYNERMAGFEPTDSQRRLCGEYVDTPEEHEKLVQAMAHVAINSAIERSRLELLSLESIGIHPDLMDARFRSYLRVAGWPHKMLEHVNWFHENIQDGHVAEIIRGHMVQENGRSIVIGDEGADPSRFSYKGILEQVKSPSSEIGSVIQFGDWTYTRDIDAAVMSMLDRAIETGHMVDIKNKKVDPRRYKLSFVEAPQDTRGEWAALSRERAFADISIDGITQHIVKRSEALVSVKRLPPTYLQRCLLGSVSLSGLQQYAPAVGRIFETEVVTGGRLRSGILPVSTTYYMRQPR